MDYVVARQVSLKGHPELSERWLQARIVENPSILGLGEVDVRATERTQSGGGGRLDLLLEDSSARRWYEVEIQLGSTDPSHIIRTIEYWDVERTRYPTLEHVAVIVAEDITSRFYNVISLFNKAIPLIAIQIRALEVNGVLTLSATKVLDLTSFGSPVEDEVLPSVTRAFWEQRGSAQSMAVLDSLLGMVNEVAPGTTFNYTKAYIGLSRNGGVDNFVEFLPRKQKVVIQPRLPRSDDLTARIEESGVDFMRYDLDWKRYVLGISNGSDLDGLRPLLLELFAAAAGESTSIE